MLVTVEKINSTGQRYVPRSCIGKTGKVVGKVHHHGREWINSLGQHFSQRRFPLTQTASMIPVETHESCLRAIWLITEGQSDGRRNGA